MERSTGVLSGNDHCCAPEGLTKAESRKSARSGMLMGMVRINRVYTHTGDAGTTALGGGQRVPKDSLRIEAYGTVDELNSVIGVVLLAGVHKTLQKELSRIQNELFHLG